MSDEIQDSVIKRLIIQLLMILPIFFVSLFLLGFCGGLTSAFPTFGLILLIIFGFLTLLSPAFGVYVGGKITGGKGKFWPVVLTSGVIALIGTILILLVVYHPWNVAADVDKGAMGMLIIPIVLVAFLLIFMLPFVIYYFSDKRETSKLQTHE